MSEPMPLLLAMVYAGAGLATLSNEEDDEWGYDIGGEG